MRKSLIITACAVVLMGGCARPGSDSSATAVPDEFRAACAHPGTQVQVLTVPVTVRHSACDLTGVTVRYGFASVAIPEHGHAEGHVETLVATTTPTRVEVTVDEKTHDVTVTG